MIEFVNYFIFINAFSFGVGIVSWFVVTCVLYMCISLVFSALEAEQTSKW